ncbi:hypothetical protein [Heliophilum fasciatum]|uniref:PhoP regulatory network protein YrbL n=1 Tax=Heliophilum fasciatum TaxID=35700 RepID=A0A4R2S885_9FIRM|nr:hypothetical protein [Heliophilum fasciatum]MCW2276919.1 hypothetical protein [Heliophilum fasciatum]TCP68621.1 hypothetical protein EDD73_10216 [Heliophilum fasciatum]
MLTLCDRFCADFCAKHSLHRHYKPSVDPPWREMGFHYVGQGQYMIVFRYKHIALKIPRKPSHDIASERNRLRALHPWASFEKYIAHGDRWLATGFVTGERLDHLIDKGNFHTTYSAILQLESDLRQSMSVTPYLPRDLQLFNLMQTPEGRLILIDTGEFIDTRQSPKRLYQAQYLSSLQRVHSLIYWLSEYATPRADPPWHHENHLPLSGRSRSLSEPRAASLFHHS